MSRIPPFFGPILCRESRCLGDTFQPSKKWLVTQIFFKRSDCRTEKMLCVSIKTQPERCSGSPVPIQQTMRQLDPSCCQEQLVRHPVYKGWVKKFSPPKIWHNSGGRTVCPRRLSFSPFIILMSTTNREKDSLLGQTAIPPEPSPFFKKEVFFHPPFIYMFMHKLVQPMIHIHNWQNKILQPILVWFLILKRGQDAKKSSWTLTYPGCERT